MVIIKCNDYISKDEFKWIFTNNYCKYSVNNTLESNRYGIVAKVMKNNLVGIFLYIFVNVWLFLSIDSDFVFNENSFLQNLFAWYRV